MRVFLIALLCLGPAVFAQRGDRPGERQVAPLKESEIPPSPVLSPEDSIKSFKLQPGFRIELVASEPLIGAPVAMAWHPDGSLYVLEMRGYMPNVDGEGEDKIPGRVSVLRDTNGDGRMDKSTVFVDGLIMPRAICLAYEGILVAEPPNVWFCRDTNGDGVSDEKTLAITGYGSQRSPEHTANGLLWGLDNWIYSANYTNRIRRDNGKWIQEPSAALSGRGQWGITQDDFGRLFFNSNSDYFRGDLVPAELLQRNTNSPGAFGANVQIARDQATFPARVNPGVNRGYERGILRADGTLASFTAACAPLIYRGDQFDNSYYGMAFVCEPAGNLVRGSRIDEANGVLTASNAFPNAEFLASTNEWFRPVNLYNGPDGALYIVDMHHGVLQHRLFVTTYVRNQYLSRGLDKPIDLGRIYRVVQEGKPLRKIEPLGKDLVAELRKTNAWHRETAQRLLVERGESSSAQELKKLASQSLNALWTLDGLKQLDEPTVQAALASSDAKVRATAMRFSPQSAPKLANDRDALVRLFASFHLGPTEELARILDQHSGEPLFRDAALSGLMDREADSLEILTRRWAEAKPSYNSVLSTLARAAAFSGKPEAINKVLNLAASNKVHRAALIDGLLNTTAVTRRNRPAPRPRTISLPAEPAAFAALKGETKFAALQERFTWPQKTGGAAEAVVRPLTAAEKEQFEAGKATYLLTCGACHQPHGLGQEGLAPPLVDSEWVTGSEARLARIIIGGVRGPMTVKDKTVNLEMPPLGVLEDEQIAAIMTYIRREWNHTASPVTKEFVEKVRNETMDREGPWTEEDLLKIK